MGSEDAIRQRAYYLWEAAGRPDGTGEHYWTLAHQEATQAYAEATANGVAKATKGKNPSAIPPAAKSPKTKDAKPVKLKPVKAEKPAKKAPKQKAAVKSQ